MRILLFSYFYPPLGGPGVQRPCKMVYYFRQGGWDIDVISVKDIIFHSYDQDMQDECDENNVYRVRSWDLMSLYNRITRKKNCSADKKIYFHTPERLKRIVREIFPIDEKIGWLPFAYRIGVYLCSQNSYDAIIATIGPYTSAVAAYLVSKRCKVPLVVDYRDSWTLHPYVKFLTIFHKRIARSWERKILRTACAISVNSKTLKGGLTQEFGENLKPKIHVMYNAWDEQDFSLRKFVKSQHDFVEFFYMGGFYGLQTPKYFISALEELLSEHLLPNDIKITFVGNFFHEISHILHNCKVNEIIEIIPQVSHKVVIEKMLNSDVLLLFAASYKGEGVIPGKLFEYLRSQKEILAMVPPEGEASEILLNNGYNMNCEMEDIPKIKLLFTQLYNKVLYGDHKTYRIRKKYSRKNQTNYFMTFLQDRIHANEI